MAIKNQTSITEFSSEYIQCIVKYNQDENVVYLDFEDKEGDTQTLSFDPTFAYQVSQSLQNASLALLK